MTSSGVPSTGARSRSSAYRPSHNDILRPLSGTGGAGRGRLDGVVVPTCRPWGRGLPGVLLALELAERFHCELLVLCSQGARAADYLRSWPEGRRARVVLVDVTPSLLRHALPDFRTSGHDTGSRLRTNDVGSKRNLALSMAVRAGWRNLLFLDDDISRMPGASSLDAAGVDTALDSFAADPGLRAVGWPSTGFPDNSVVGHARRAAGMDQDVFVSAAGLAVVVDTATPFFPDIYNEDWLFLVAAAAQASRWKGSIGHAGEVAQLPYEPFRPARARSEEIGDLIGEGVFNLLEDDGPAFWHMARRAEFWQRTLVERTRMLTRIHGLVPRRQDVRAALGAAADVHLGLDPAGLANFVSCWKSDLVTWREHLAALHRRVKGAERGSMMDAWRSASHLHLDEGVRAYDFTGSPHGSPAETAPAPALRN